MAYSQISIRLGGLAVELGTEAQYPDMVSDLTSRWAVSPGQTRKSLLFLD
jgi:hypothetical protein